MAWLDRLSPYGARDNPGSKWPSISHSSSLASLPLLSDDQSRPRHATAAFAISPLPIAAAESRYGINDLVEASKLLMQESFSHPLALHWSNGSKASHASGDDLIVPPLDNHPLSADAAPWHHLFSQTVVNTAHT